MQKAHLTKHDELHDRPDAIITQLLMFRENVV